MKKFTSLLGGVLIAMFFVAFNTGCGQHALANPLMPPDPVLNPTPAATVTPGGPVATFTPTPGVTPGTTHTYYMTFTAPAGTAFEAWSDKFTGAPYTVTRQPYNVPAGGTWTSTSTVVGTGETYHGELLCNSSPGNVTVYRDGVVWNQVSPLSAGTLYAFTY